MPWLLSHWPFCCPAFTPPLPPRPCLPWKSHHQVMPCRSISPRTSMKRKVCWLMIVTTINLASLVPILATLARESREVPTWDQWWHHPRQHRWGRREKWTSTWQRSRCPCHWMQEFDWNLMMACGSPQRQSREMTKTTIQTVFWVFHWKSTTRSLEAGEVWITVASAVGRGGLRQPQSRMYHPYLFTRLHFEHAVSQAISGVVPVKSCQIWLSQRRRSICNVVPEKWGFPMAFLNKNLMNPEDIWWQSGVSDKLIKPH